MTHDNDPHAAPDEFDDAALEQLRNAVKALPREVPPPAEAWSQIQARIERTRVRQLVPGSAPLSTPSPARLNAAGVVKRWPRSSLLVAATVLVAVTSLITARSVSKARDDAARSVASAGRTAIPGTAAPAPATPGPVTRDTTPASVNPDASPSNSASRFVSRASLATVFDRYDAAAADLAGELQQRRSRLDPATVAVLDSCLRRIDDAIAEARSALAKTPDNTVIAGLLTVTYQQKMDLLRRAAELPLRSL